MKTALLHSFICAVVFANYAVADESYVKQPLIDAAVEADSRSTEWKPGEGIPLEVSGMAWKGSQLYLCIRKGDVYVLENPQEQDPAKLSYRLFASGLHEPLGLEFDGDDLLVSQRAEITRLKDNDGDGMADAYLTECDGWDVTGNYHAYTYGPERDGKGRYWVTLNLGMGDLTDNSRPWHGWGGIIGEDGRFQPMAAGMRSPCGLGANKAGDMFYTDQQGTYFPGSPVYHLREGVFYGNQQSLDTFKLDGAPFQLDALPPKNVLYPEALKASKRFVPPAVWLPYNKMGRSTTDIQVIDQNGAFGPFDGQLLVGEFTNAAVSRVFLEKVNGDYQGACFPFLEGFSAAVVRLSFSPQNELFVGLTNRGWSSLGARSYGLTRVKMDKAPFSVQKIEATPEGFRVTFTEPADLESIKTAPLSLQHFTYEYSDRYGGDEVETRGMGFEIASISAEGDVVEIIVPNRKEHYIYEFDFSGIRAAAGNRDLDYTKGYYTLNSIPKL